MSALKLMLIALGLSADAFAVSIAEGIVIKRGAHRHTVRVAAMFGLFQGVMPVLGWMAGSCLWSVIGSFDHWVAFGLLAMVGGKMVLEALFGDESETHNSESRGGRLIMLGLATSIDAFAVGMSIAMLRVAVWTPAIVIGAVTAAVCAVGVQAGSRIGMRLGRAAGIAGGLVLLGLGVKILLEHLL